MILINPIVELIPQHPDLEGIYKQIELVGRSCWMSQNLIKEGSAVKFIENLLKNTHTSCLEHGTVYLKCSDKGPDEYGQVNSIVPLKGNYAANKYSTVHYEHWKQEPDKIQKEFCGYIPRTTEYVTTNFRVLVENDWLEDLQYICEPTKFHEKRYTFHFTCQRAISAEYNRHRVNSPMESSSRYCNFSKDKFGNEISVCPAEWVEKAWLIENEKEPHDSITDNLEYSNRGLEEYCHDICNGYTEHMSKVDWWWFANLASERSYMELIKLGCKPEEARDILPLDLKTELYHTATVEQWKHFCELRAWDSKGNKPHPEAVRLARPIWDKLLELGEVTDDFRTGRDLSYQADTNA